jgi:hypothetical protein
MSPPKVSAGSIAIGPSNNETGEAATATTVATKAVLAQIIFQSERIKRQS